MRADDGLRSRRFGRAAACSSANYLVESVVGAGGERGGEHQVNEPSIDVRVIGAEALFETMFWHPRSAPLTLARDASPCAS